LQTVNLVCHCPDFGTLAFKRDFVFSEQTSETTAGDPDPQSHPFVEVTVPELIQLNKLDSIEIDSDLTLSMDDARSAFAADAELRLFCIGDGATEQFPQTLANLLQIRVVAFTDARLAFKVEVIEGAEISGRPALSKRIVVTPRFSTSFFEFNNFEQMVTEDAAKTGRLVRLPRRS
jgi:hypothetical protein